MWQNAANFAERLAEVMKKMLLISEVATLAKDLEVRSNFYQEKGALIKGASSTDTLKEKLKALMVDVDSSDDKSIHNSVEEGGNLDLIIGDATEILSSHHKARISELLGSWEEPARGKFGQSVSCEIANDYLPFYYPLVCCANVHDADRERRRLVLSSNLDGHLHTWTRLFHFLPHSE